MMLPPPSVGLVNFINASPTPFHAIQSAALRLEKSGFRNLKERDTWDNVLQPGGKYYFTRNQVALLAFSLPRHWQPGTGVSIVATHVDSPNLRVRPISKRTSSGYLQVGVETYGSGIWHSWFDRDLSLAGRVVVSHPGGDFQSRLVKIDRPILRIPSLAIHLDRNVNDNLKFNRETEFVPIAGLINSKLNQEQENDISSGASSIQANHHSALLSLLAGELSVAPSDIYDFELALYDTHASTLGGFQNEFIFSPRLDNLFSSFCAVESISAFQDDGSGANVNCVALFNHEEIGSVSTSGAQSNLVQSFLERLSPTPDQLARSIARSFLISSDMTHALHPNYLNKHEDNHRPRMNGGVTIKTNATQRYATDSIGSFLVKRLIESKGGKVQEYEVRNDMACGSTVGPALSALGLRTVDVGCPMLSMHSARETAGADDVQSLLDLFEAFFQNFSKLDQSLHSD